MDELVYDDPHSSVYELDVSTDADSCLASIDSLRMGIWTRFINHSCNANNANTEFNVLRVGQEARQVVRAMKPIRAGE